MVVPSSLPDIDAVEIVNLRGLRPNGVDHFMALAIDSRYVRLVGRDAGRIARLWQKLPSGKQMRCHLPPFALRFYSGDRLICQASICWRCNNIFGNAGSDEVFFEFDGSCRESLELLSECEKVLGGAAAE